MNIYEMYFFLGFISGYIFRYMWYRFAIVPYERWLKKRASMRNASPYANHLIKDDKDVK